MNEHRIRPLFSLSLILALGAVTAPAQAEPTHAPSGVYLDAGLGVGWHSGKMSYDGPTAAGFQPPVTLHLGHGYAQPALDLSGAVGWWLSDQFALALGVDGLYVAPMGRKSMLGQTTYDSTLLASVLAEFVARPVRSHFDFQIGVGYTHASYMTSGAEVDSFDAFDVPSGAGGMSGRFGGGYRFGGGFGLRLVASVGVLSKDTVHDRFTTVSVLGTLTKF